MVLDDVGPREEINRGMAEFGIAIEQPHDVEIGDITIRPTAQN